MRAHRCPDISSYLRMTTAELRGGFLLDGLFTHGMIDLVYTDLDRAIVGSAVPLNEPLELTAGPELRANFFCERRELGILNVGGPGSVTVDGTRHILGKLDMLYVSRGSRHVLFEADAHTNPPLFYLVSYPAHATHPTTRATPADANVLELGARETANERKLSQMIHENGVKSCQLVMGFTEMKTGGVWNTMPPHTHDRRTEVYLYFDIPEGHRVLHLCGKPDETRPLWIGNLQVALSPSWSVHCGCGTSNYRFSWAMGGENQRFDDMDPAPVPPCAEPFRKPYPMDTTQQKPGNYRWYISVLLFSATTLYYFDRQIFSYVINSNDKSYAKLLGFLGADGKVDNVLYSRIDTAHKIAYAIGFLLMGRFLDWIGLKRGFAIGVAVWSLATVAAAFLHSFWPLYISVLVLGFFQAANHPGCVKTVSEWFPARDRSIAVGFYNSGTNFGAMIVSSVIPFICVYLGGWKMAYIIPGLIGFIWVFLWLRAYGKPDTHLSVGPAERAYIADGRTQTSTYKLGWGTLLRSKRAWGFAVAKFLIDPVWFIYLSWLPKIFKESYGVDFKNLFIPITLIYTVSLIGNFAGGGLSSYFLRRGWSINRSRKLAMLVFSLIAMPSFVSAYVSNMWVVVAIVGCVTFAHQAYSTLLFTSVADVFPKHVVGSVTGFGSMFGAIGGIVAAFSAGYVAKAFGYAPFYFLGSFAYLLGLLVMHLLNPKMQHVDAI